MMMQRFVKESNGNPLVVKSLWEKYQAVVNDPKVQEYKFKTELEKQKYADKLAEINAGRDARIREITVQGGIDEKLTKMRGDTQTGVANIYAGAKNQPMPQEHLDEYKAAVKEIEADIKPMKERVAAIMGKYPGNKSMGLTDSTELTNLRKQIQTATKERDSLIGKMRQAQANGASQPKTDQTQSFKSLTDLQAAVKDGTVDALTAQKIAIENGWAQ
jgi:hypothetical protein